MPLIDNYLLDNYAINGPQQGIVYSTTKPSIASGNVGANANQTGWLYGYASIEGNVKIVSLSPTTTASYWGVRSNLGSVAFGLKDSNGLIWQMTPPNTGSNSTLYTLNLYNLQIDLIAGDVIYTIGTTNSFNAMNNTTAMAGQILSAKPSGFDMSNQMILGAYITSPYTAGWVVNVYGAGMKLLTA